MPRIFARVAFFLFFSFLGSHDDGALGTGGDTGVEEAHLELWLSRQQHHSARCQGAEPQDRDVRRPRAGGADHARCRCTFSAGRGVTCRVLYINETAVANKMYTPLQ